MNNLVAAGTHLSSSGNSYCLVRVESNPQAGMYRLSVRSPQAPLTSALNDAIGFFITN